MLVASAIRVTEAQHAICKNALPELILSTVMVAKLEEIVLEEDYAIIRKEHANVSLAFTAPVVSTRPLYIK